MSRSPVEVIYGPLVTERSYSLYQQGRYTFRVANSATKPEIARALEEQYEAQGVKVAAVNTINMRGKVRRTGRRGNEVVRIHGRAKPAADAERLRHRHGHNGNLAFRTPARGSSGHSLPRDVSRYGSGVQWREVSHRPARRSVIVGCGAD